MLIVLPMLSALRKSTLIAKTSTRSTPRLTRAQQIKGQTHQTNLRDGLKFSSRPIYF